MSDPSRAENIIIKKVKKVEGGHHGGAWKVAYADFVTAMMAFFLLMWLLNVSTDEAKEKISSFFDPSHPRIADLRSGAGGLLGGLSVSKVGAMMESTQPIVNPNSPQPVPAHGGTKTNDPKADDAREGGRNEADGQPAKSPEDISKERLLRELKEREEEEFKKAEEELKKAIEAVPELAELKDNIQIDRTPEGLRIQILDQDDESMFPLGSARMYEKTRNLLSQVSVVINKLPNDISVRGHTDAYKYAGGSDYSNWELSADRANASRRALIQDGIGEERFANVIGKAYTEPFVEDDPFDPRNRRISIVLLRRSFLAEIAELEGDTEEYERQFRPDTEIRKQYQKTPGDVEFP